MNCRLAVFLLLLPLTIFANTLPDSVVPHGVGVNIHFIKGNEKDLDLIAAAGFKWVRMDFMWNYIEEKKGVYDFSPYDELTRNLEKRGLSAIYILDYSNAHYEGTVDSPNPITHTPEKHTASPQHRESIEAFAKWAAAAAKHFRGHKIAWEIWNEPNIFFWRPKPDARQYSALALAAAKAIRAANPKATILAPATSTIDFAFLETAFKAGLLKHLDAVSVHPYRGDPPETTAKDYEKLRLLIDRYAPHGKRIPIVSGEWGYSSSHGQFSVETQADYAVRQQLSNLSQGIPLSIWYDWKNDGPQRNNAEHNFGTVTSDLQPKLTYTAIQRMTKELDGYHFAERLSVGKSSDYVLLFKKRFGGKKLAYWTTEKPHSVGLGAAKHPILNLTSSPQYLKWR